MNFNGLDAGALSGVLLASVAFGAIAYVWMALALSSVFTKLGERAFTAWVPVLNLITLYRLGGVRPLWILINLAPVVGAVAGAVLSLFAIHGVNKRFGFGAGMTVLAGLLAPVWASVVGFGPAVPIGGVPRAGAAVDPLSFSPPPLPPGIAPAPWTPRSAALAPLTAPTRVHPDAEPDGLEITDPPAAISATTSAPATAPARVDPHPPAARAAPSAPVVFPLLVEPEARPPVELQSADEGENVDVEMTVAKPRMKKESWVLTADGAAPVTLTKPAAILGRNPGASSVDAQLVTIHDPSRTVSKTHARLTLVDGQWSIVDLNSTNGVYLLSADDQETEVEVGVAALVGDAFRLGDLTVRISKDK